VTTYAVPIYQSQNNWRQAVSIRFGDLPSKRLTSTATYDPPSIAAGASASTTVTVTGALLGQQAAAAFSLSLGGLYMTASVTAADTVTVTLVNPTAGTIDLASGTLSAFAWVA
jgi:hypothetical protein